LTLEWQAFDADPWMRALLQHTVLLANEQLTDAEVRLSDALR
jgi:hypothetical protein